MSTNRTGRECPPGKKAAGCRLTFRAGRPVFEAADGTALGPSTYCDCIVQPPDEWIARNRDFVDSGVRLFFLSERIEWDAHATGYWTDEDVYSEPGPDAFCLEREAESLIAMDHEARFFVRFSEMVPRRWAERHPQEMAPGYTGRRYSTVSWASELALNHYCRYLRHVIAWCENRP